MQAVFLWVINLKLSLKNTHWICEYHFPFYFLWIEFWFSSTHLKELSSFSQSYQITCLLWNKAKIASRLFFYLEQILMVISHFFVDQAQTSDDNTPWVRNMCARLYCEKLYMWTMNIHDGLQVQLFRGIVKW